MCYFSWTLGSGWNKIRIIASLRIINGRNKLCSFLNKLKTRSICPLVVLATTLILALISSYRSDSNVVASEISWRAIKDDQYVLISFAINIRLQIELF